MIQTEATPTPPAAAMRDAALPSMSASTRFAIEPGVKEFTACVRDDEWSNLHSEIDALYRWSDDRIAEDSPIAIPSNPTEEKDLFLQIFKAGDVLQCRGYVKGRPEPYLFLRQADAFSEEGLKQISSVSPFVIPANAASSGTAVSLVRRFLVMSAEATEYGDNASSILRWIVEEFGLDLRAVTSDMECYHGWFEPIDDELFEKLASWLPHFGLIRPESFSNDQSLIVPGSDPSARLRYIKK